MTFDNETEFTTLYDGEGYVRAIDSMGSDESIVEAARMSTSKKFGGWGTPDAPGDEKLLDYLYRNDHLTPFEMVHAVFEIQAPIFVARQIFRHRTFSFNELSARYTELPDVEWSPAPEDVRSQPRKGNKQVGVAGLDPKAADEFATMVAVTAAQRSNDYQRALSLGVAREQARTLTSVGTFTRWRQAGNLRNWFHFLALRLDPHAQAETRVVAGAVYARPRGTLSAIVRALRSVHASRVSAFGRSRRRVARGRGGVFGGGDRCRPSCARRRAVAVTDHPIRYGPGDRDIFADNPPPSVPAWALVAAKLFPLAVEVARGATCPRASVGAVILTVDGRIVATGYNGAPRGLPHCRDVGCDVRANHCERVEHAERNALFTPPRLVP